MIDMRARRWSGLIAAVLIGASVGIATPTPAAAECPNFDLWPRMREAAPSAKRVVIGTVRDVQTRRPRRSGSWMVTDFRIDVTEDVKGSGPVLIDLPGVTTDGRCISSRLSVREGDRIAVAFGGRADGIAGPVSAVAFVGAAPHRSNGLSMEQVTARQVRQLARLPAGPLLFFVADDGRGPALWRSDGTKRGTRIVAHPARGGPADPRDLAAAAGLLYFSATDRKHGRELWVSDGSAEGTRVLRDIRPGPEGSDPAGLVAGFGVEFAADDGRHGREPWVTHPATGRTRLIHDMNQVPNRSASSNPTEGASDGWQPFFSVDDGIHGREPWYAENTQVLDVWPGPMGSDPRDFTTVDWTTWFAADAPEAAEVLHACEDGCSEPSRIAVDGQLVVRATDLTGADHVLYFVASDAAGQVYLGRATQTWEGTRWDDPILTRDAATHVMSAPPPSTDPPPEGPFSQLASLGDRLYLSIDEAATGTELWSSDGTPEGTAVLLDLPGADLDPRNLVAIGKRLWFSADPDDGTGREPWLSDGTAEGTKPVTDIARDGDSDPADFIGFRSLAVFTADDGLHGREVWLSDRTEQGARLILDIRPGPAGSEPTEFVVLGRTR